MLAYMRYICVTMWQICISMGDTTGHKLPNAYLADCRVCTMPPIVKLSTIGHITNGKFKGFAEQLSYVRHWLKSTIFKIGFLNWIPSNNITH
jgi:hypothetical protein